MAPVVIQCRKEETAGPTECHRQLPYPFIHSFIQCLFIAITKCQALGFREMN